MRRRLRSKSATPGTVPTAQADPEAVAARISGMATGPGAGGCPRFSLVQGVPAAALRGLYAGGALEPVHPVDVLTCFSRQADDGS
jgi:hypothetical protein